MAASVFYISSFMLSDLFPANEYNLLFYVDSFYSLYLFKCSPEHITQTLAYLLRAP